MHGSVEIGFAKVLRGGVRNVGYHVNPVFLCKMCGISYLCT